MPERGWHTGAFRVLIRAVALQLCRVRTTPYASPYVCLYVCPYRVRSTRRTPFRTSHRTCTVTANQRLTYEAVHFRVIETTERTKLRRELRWSPS
jgi:hypothetical protein